MPSLREVKERVEQNAEPTVVNGLNFYSVNRSLLPYPSWTTFCKGFPSPLLEPMVMFGDYLDSYIISTTNKGELQVVDCTLSTSNRYTAHIVSSGHIEDAYKLVKILHESFNETFNVMLGELKETGLLREDSGENNDKD